MNLEFKQAVDECIGLMRTGATLESCLARYPQYTEDLQPILRMAQNVKALSLPQERPESVQAGRQRLMSAYQKRTAARPVSESSIARFIQQLLIKLTGKDDLDMKLVARFALVLLLVIGLLVGGGVTATVSASALPGDALYPLKLSLEDINLFLANNPQARQQLELQYQGIRQQEVQSVLQLGRQAQVNFSGVLTVVTPDSWTIGGLPVKLDSGTQMVGAATLGSIIHVEGETKSDGTILAHRLTVQGQGANPMDPTPGSMPSAYPTHEPTLVSTQMPTMMQTNQSTAMPSMMPTHQPTALPSMMPTNQPTAMPTIMPTHQSTSMPTMMPTNPPTSMPTMMPTNKPTSMATTMPTHQPTSMPTMNPTMMLRH
jgi:hypothetical protein